LELGFTDQTTSALLDRKSQIKAHPLLKVSFVPISQKLLIIKVSRPGGRNLLMMMFRYRRRQDPARKTPSQLKTFQEFKEVGPVVPQFQVYRWIGKIPF